MYKHSPQTFLSLTAQRARHSASRQELYGEDDMGSSSASSQFIHFTELEEGGADRLWADLRRSLGER